MKYTKYVYKCLLVHIALTNVNWYNFDLKNVTKFNYINKCCRNVHKSLSINAKVRVLNWFIEINSMN